jgi:hypothetical protein
MNQKDRKAISSSLAKLDEARDMLSAMHSDLEVLRDTEQEKFDNMPEGLQAGERGQAIEQAAEKLAEWVEYLQEALDSLSNIDEGDME